jgi:hypothetical protein
MQPLVRYHGRSAQHAKKNMAASSLLALIDDIASILDDVALLTKAATEDRRRARRRPRAERAAGVGVAAERELPVVWAVAKGRSSTRPSSCPPRWPSARSRRGP